MKTVLFLSAFILFSINSFAQKTSQINKAATVSSKNYKVTKHNELGQKITFHEFAEEQKMNAEDIKYMKKKIGIQAIHVKICQNVNANNCKIFDMGHLSCAAATRRIESSPQFRHWSVQECFTAGSGKTYVVLTILTVAKQKKRVLHN